MTHWITYPVARLLQSAQRRYRTARPGSVLILVVTLLVLMALIGTAYIATTRTDRYTSVQHVKNVQIDLLVEGVVNQVTSAVNGDLHSSNPSAFRPPDDLSPNSTVGEKSANGFDMYDYPGLYGPVHVPASSVTTAQNEMPDDLWLSGRVPRTQQTAAPYAAYLPAAGGMVVVWDSPSYPLIQNGPTPDQPWQFDSPEPGIASLQLGLPFRPLPTAQAMPPSTLTFQSKPWVSPTFRTLTNPATGEARTYPAMQAYEWVQGGPPTFAPVGQLLIAADTDGDGIADALLWKLPIGRIDGVTYYAAIRIVDNNSAVNVNMAWSNREYAVSGAQQIPHYFFPSSIGLEEMLRSYQPANLLLSAQNTETDLLSRFRFNQDTSASGQRFQPPSLVLDDRGPNGTPRNDYVYSSLQEAVQAQLGSRVGNPGFTGVGTKMQGFGLPDTEALAYHNVLLNPDLPPSPESLEGLLLQASAPGGIIDSVYRGAFNYDATYTKHQNSFASNGQLLWYQGNGTFPGNYNVETETFITPPQPNTFEPRRSLLTASSPVCNTAPIHFVTTTPLAPVGITSQVNLPQYCLDAGMPNYATLMPSVTPPRTSINQAPFGELWRAFWNVMVENVQLSGVAQPAYLGTPFDAYVHAQATSDSPHARTITQRPAYDPVRPDPCSLDSPYIGQTFADYAEPFGSPTGSYEPNPLAAPLTAIFNPGNPVGSALYFDYHPARMFRSSIRAIPDPNRNPADASGRPVYSGFDHSSPRLNAVQMMLLRSAIAAVNAEDLRDSDNNVTAKRVLLYPTFGPAGGNGLTQIADAVVYGTERQPYITEVYAETDTHYAPAGPLSRNPDGYVCIELYNPYDQDIELTNWKLAAIDRRNQTNPSSAGGVPPPYQNIAGTTHPPLAGVAPIFNLPLDHSTLIADFDPASAPTDVILPNGTSPAAGQPLVVPQHGYLILENYNSVGAATANHRPRATGLVDGDLTTNASYGFLDGTQHYDASIPRVATNGLTQVNIACVPGLSGVIDVNWNQPEWPVGVRSVLNRELVILRPRNADGTYSKGTYPVPVGAPPGTLPLPFDEDPLTNGIGRVDLRDLVPVDSFDFTGLKLPVDTPIVPEPLAKGTADPNDPNPTWASAWHYVRRNLDPNGNLYWGFVYPGRYDATVEMDIAFGEPRPRQAGTEHTSWAQPAVGVVDGNIAWPYPASGSVTGTGSNRIAPTFGGDGTVPTSSANTSSSYPASFNVPLAVGNGTPIGAITAVTQAIGANPMIVPPAQQRFPYGGFARDGDMLSVPYIGAYRITYPNAGSGFTVAELNSVTADAVYAEDTDVNDDPKPDIPVGQPGAGTGDLQSVTTGGGGGMREREQLGRFCPIRVTTTPLGAAGTPVPDYSPGAGYPTINYTQPPAPPPNTPPAANRVVVNDFGYDPSFQPSTVPPIGANWAGYWRYRWASDLFAYLTASSPADDYQPNYPMQREWEAGQFHHQDSAGGADLVSVYNAATNAHEIYQCTAPVPAGYTAPSLPTPLPAIPPPASFRLIWSVPALKNTSGATASIRQPRPLINAAAETLEHTEDDVPIEGLININTAPWRVLATLPLIVDRLGVAPGLPDDNASGINIPSIGIATYRQLNQEMAKAIVYWRDIDCSLNPAPNHPKYPHGPFRSIYELNQVVDLRPNAAPAASMPAAFPTGTLPGFQNGYWTVPLANAAGVDPIDDSYGDFAPDNVMAGATTADGVRGDYKERFLQLDRISNLITTRSDSFTCYIQVQGWQDAETPAAKMVVQRRKAFIIDRSRVTSRTGGASPQYFYND